MKRIRTILGLSLVGYLATGLNQIRPEEKAVVFRFGRVVAQPGPGLWIGLPYGIDRVERVPLAVVRRVPVGYRPELAEEIPGGQYVTGDQNLVNIQVAVDYAVGDETDDLVNYVMHRRSAEALITRSCESTLNDWASGRGVDDVLLNGNTVLPDLLRKRLNADLSAHRLGIRIVQAGVSYLAPPDEVRQSFEEVNRAQTFARSQENRAMQEASMRKSDASANVHRLEGESAATADRVRKLARAEAESFEKRLATYHQLRATDPDVLTVIWWNEMGRIWTDLRNRGRVDLLDHHVGPNGLDITSVLPPRRK